MKRLVLLFISCLSFTASFAGKKQVPAYLELQQPVNAINLVMIHDVISPPVAARYYAYAMLSAYQLVAENDNEVVKPAAFIKSFPEIKPPAVKSYDHRIAAVYAIYETAKNMLPSGFMLQDDENAFTKQLLKNKIKQQDIDNALQAAVNVSSQIIGFSKIDNYSKLSAKLRYTPKKGEQYWYPTPPVYMEAVEPHWNSIRPLIADSAGQFKPKPPVEFSKDTASRFYALAKEVINVSANLTPEQTNIADFWDCNPFAVTTSGHMAIGFKKISPGGHWMNIGTLAVKQANLNFDQSVLVITSEAITMMDAFICCWDEKYLVNRIRPETYINRYMDITWKPHLQTPPFPEYTSGHAIVSNSCATVLSFLLGNHFAYTDDTEVSFGVGPRSFTSFMQAASEASVSRLYGGIHYRDSIDEGNKQGVAAGNYIVARLKQAGVKPVIN